MVFLKLLILRLIKLNQRYPGLVALFGFLSGVASFLLVERKESLAQIIALIMLAGWIWLMLENTLRAGLLRRFGLEMPPSVMRYATQMVHQESLFFALPFFFAVTTWGHGQVLFTGLLLVCALVSIVDPIYYKQLAPRRALFVVFHALALFAVLLVALPLLLHLTSGQSMAIALLVSLLLSLPTLGRIFPDGHWWRLPLTGLLLIALAGGLWQVRSLVPPAALRLSDIALSQEMDRESRSPGSSITTIDEESLLRDGLYAWTAVRAPRGLREKIHHVWMHEGVEVDRITLDISGGREEGYRAWTQKINFPSKTAGHWQINVVTDADQLIGLIRFTVSKTDGPASEPLSGHDSRLLYRPQTAHEDHGEALEQELDSHQGAE